jgi:hypothetical protein
MRIKESAPVREASMVEEKVSVCTICGKPTARLVDGEPSCEEHAALIYENQLEDETLGHLGYREASKH